MVRGFIITALLIIAGCAHTPPEQKTVFEDVCEFTGWDCSEVAPPTIVYSLIIDVASGGFWKGVYFPTEPYVFVDTHYSEEEQYRVAFHEVVHYLHWALGIYATDEKCGTEGDARKLTALRFNTEYSDDWKASYGC